VSGVLEAPPMKQALRAADVEALIREIRRYLSYVDAFRNRAPEPPARPQGRKEP
jgi:hypothetical protein